MLLPIGEVSTSLLGFSSITVSFFGASLEVEDVFEVFWSPRRARTPPIFTSTPSSTFISVIEPALGAGTSTVILSVSISTNGSSASNESPTFLSHLDTVA